MDSAASGLIEAFKIEFDGEVPDWDRIALGMYYYGSGGIRCWGTLCGIPNGCCALLSLLSLHGPLASEVLGQYSGTEFPTSKLRTLFEDPYYGYGGTGGYIWSWTPVPDDQVLAHTVSHSPLCHVSISKWCYAAGVDLGTCPWEDEDFAPSAKNDRCGKICADMAGYTAELINYYATTSGVETPYVLPEETAECKRCHFKSGNPGDSPAQCGLMDCEECHTDFQPHYGKKILLERLWTEKLVGSDWQESNVFAPGDKIRYCMRLQLFAPGMMYVRVKPATSGAEGYKTPTGLWKQGYFNKNDNCCDTETWRFDNGGGGYTIPADASGKARFKVRIQVADTSSGPLIYESPTKMVYFTVS